jgi:hypothetical protein
MTNTIHIMLDLETWGTTPGSDIRSIGACVFDPMEARTVGLGGTPDPTMFYIACDNPSGRWRNGIFEPYLATSINDRMYPLTRDPRTVQWWSEQSDEAQAAFANPVDLREALERFGVWLFNMTDNAASKPYDTNHLRLWSHGSHFDPPILAAAYPAVGLPVPWHYRAPRDTRTLFDAAGIDDDGDGSYRTFMTAFNHGTAHNALDDAIAQARCVCAAYATIRTWVEAQLHTACPPVVGMG